jgi:hypothetical protein
MRPLWSYGVDGANTPDRNYRYVRCVVDDAELVLRQPPHLRARGPPTDEPRSALGRRHRRRAGAHPPALAARDQAKQKKPNSNRRRRSAPLRVRVENAIRGLTRFLSHPHRSGGRKREGPTACRFAP